MALSVSIQRVWSWVIALYKFLKVRPTLQVDPNVFPSLFRPFVLLLKFLRSKLQTWHEKQGRSKPPSSNLGSSEVESGDLPSEHLEEVDADQVVISLDSISCSLYPYDTGLHNSSRSLQILNASRSSHNLDIVSRSRNTSLSSHNVGSSHAQSPLGGGYTFTIQPTSPRRTYSMSSPELGGPRAADLHDAIPHIPPNFTLPRSDSPVGSVQLLAAGEISSSRTHSPLTSAPQIEQSTELPPLSSVGTSPRIHSDDMEIPKLDHPRIYPVVPENFQRYNKSRRIPKKATRVNMKPMAIDFSDHLDPAGWAVYTHPEGARYFYNEKKRIFTDTDLYDRLFLQVIEQYIDIIETFIAGNHISIPEKTDLVLDIDLDSNGDYITDYYFANHPLRIIFFLDHFSSDYLPNWEEIKGVNSGRHLRHEMESQYWWHCILYPNALQLSDDLVCQLRDIVMHYIGDIMTSPCATSPYALDDLYKILSLADGLKENIGKPYSGCTSLISRLMFAFTHTKFLHFHGQPEARLNRDQSVHGFRTNQRTWFIKTISIFLFSAPDVHLQTLQKLWVDGIMHKAVWETSLKKMNDEWTEFILYSTVLLNANVGFLAIPSTDAISSAAISSYFSIVTSIGSIIIGLLLVRQNQTKHRDTADDAQRFLRLRAHPILGLETLAIMFSLPYALLMWSMVSFLAAFLLLCFEDSTVVIRSVIGCLSGVIAVLVAWCIWSSWEKYPPSDAETPEDSLSFENGDDSEEGPKNFTFEVVLPEPTEESRPSAALGLRLPLLFTWPAFLHPQRQSYDSNGTVIGDP